MRRFLHWTPPIRRDTVSVMKRKLLIGMSAAFCLAFSAISALGQGVPDHNLSDFKLGDHVSGDNVDLSTLEGKVVAIEYWGTR
jgi:hypothetical protein